MAAASEAERAGLLDGDELIAVDGVAVSTMTAARARLAGPLADVIVKVRRAGQEKSIRVAREPTRR